MTIPQLTLLGFAAWTILVPLSAIAVYRWLRILQGRERIEAFRSDQVHGADWYRRAMRAHANCVENLPVFGALVLLLPAAGISAPWIDQLCMTLLAARIVQTSIHIGFVETTTSVSFRFTFFFVQFLAMLTLAAALAASALG